MAEKPTTRVVTGPARLSYAHIFEPFSQNPDQPAKYSTVLLIPKSDKATMKKLRAAQKAALENGKDTKFGGKIPTRWTDTIHDGDEEADLERNPEYAGHWYVSVSSNQKPGVVDLNRDPIYDSTEIYSGCYARASLNAFPFNTQGNKGVSFGLNHIQKVKDGEPLGGRTRAEDDFDDDFGGDGLDDDEDDLV